MRVREPQLRRLAVVRPDLVDEWVPELNDADVSSLPCTSQLSVWWRCTTCGENFQAVVKDRAVADKGCPHCAVEPQRPEQTLHTDGEVAASAAETGGRAPSLAETHPALLSRWDYERNGLLRPTDVTSTSGLCVWWKPAEGRPAHERSFRRPVDAFVEVPYSVEEQEEARAAVELDILQQVRQAANVDKARELGLLSEDAALLDDLFLKKHKEGFITGSFAERKQEVELVGEDLHKAIEAWERGFDLKSDADVRPVFHFTELCDLAEVSRDHVLATYNQFVMENKDSNKTEETVHTDRSPNPNMSAVPSAITDPDWVQHFTLSMEDVSKDRFASSARLIFADPVTSASPSTQPVKEHERDENNQGETDRVGKAPRRVDTLPPPPEEYEDEVHTFFAQPKRSYPRRPPMPPSREDDVTEAVPKAAEDGEQDASRLNGETRKRRSGLKKGGLPAEAAFEVLSISSSQSLAQEYALSSSSSSKNALFDASEEDLNQGTLLGPLAMQSMTNEQARALQYNRETPRPRRTGRFRLRAPDDSDFKGQMAVAATLGSFVSSRSERQQQQKHQREEEKTQQVIQAPGAPRKVARPKRKSKEVVE